MKKTHKITSKKRTRTKREEEGESKTLNSEKGTALNDSNFSLTLSIYLISFN